MGRILTRDEAWELLKEYNKETFHLRHGGNRGGRYALSGTGTRLWR